MPKNQYGKNPFEILSDKLQGAVAKKGIRTVDAREFIFNLFSLDLFMFIGLPVIREIATMDDVQLATFIERRKKRSFQAALQRHKNRLGLKGLYMSVGASDLCKSFGERRVLDKISFEIGKQNFTLLGLNGAGKTTVINIICRLLKYDSGEVSVCGFDPRIQTQEVRKRIGLVTQDTSIYNYLTAKENLFRSNAEILKKCSKHIDKI